jgi:hypothetical protein
VGRALARIEKKGIPTFTVTRQGFPPVVKNCFMSLGLTHDASLFEFPSSMFLPGGDLSPLERYVDKIVHGLTGWESTQKTKASAAVEMLTVEAEDYVQAIEKLNTIFLQKSWGDGFPVMPATEARVNWVLTGTDLPRDTAIGRIMPSGRTATIESLAISLAMTGGRPEHLPVLIAAFKAFTDPKFRHQMMQATTCSVNVAAILDGPISRQIRMNAGYGCLGPDPQHPAGAAVGRAMRLTQQNVGQAIPGQGTMAIFGGPQKFANVVFAEDEEGLPEGWDPLSVERGFAKGSNVVTVHAIATSSNITVIHASNPEVVLETMHHCARIMGSDYGNIFLNYYQNSAPGILVLPRGIVQGMVNAGWTKKTVKEFLWEHSKFPVSVVSSDSEHWHRTATMMKEHVRDGQPWPMAVRAQNLMIAVAGGAHSGHGYWMRMGCCPTQPISVEIELPKNWDALIAKAEADLGPLPAY